MKSRFRSNLEDDPTPSRVLIERYRASLDRNEDDAGSSLELVHYRGTEEELNLGLEYSRSTDPKDRITAACTLAQLGWSDRTHLEQSVNRLIEMLSDENLGVINEAAVALGHRGEPRAIPHLLPLVTHPDAQVRYAVTFGLLSHDDAHAISALITLASDPDSDVRDWAVFGLGSQIETDTTAIREALWKALKDDSSDVRGEALVGLANRRAPGAIDAIIQEWRVHKEIHGISIEAASEFEGFPEDGQFGSEDEEMSQEEYRARLIEALDTCRPAAAAATRWHPEHDEGNPSESGPFNPPPKH